MNGSNSKFQMNSDTGIGNRQVKSIAYTTLQMKTKMYSFPSHKQMVPLLKKSSDVLVEKMGEFAESGKSVELFR